MSVNSEVKHIRCKMNVNSVRDVGSAIRYELGAVYSSRPDHENTEFSTATPCAFFTMDVSKNSRAASNTFLVPGAQVYVDLSLAEVPEWNWSFDRYPEADRELVIRVGSIDSDEIRGLYKRRVDPRWFAEQGIRVEYPVLVLADGQEFKLYDDSKSWVPYYWKYSEGQG